MESCVKSYVETHPNPRTGDNGTPLWGQGCGGWNLPQLSLRCPLWLLRCLPLSRVWKSLM